MSTPEGRLSSVSIPYFSLQILVTPPFLVDLNCNAAYAQTVRNQAERILTKYFATQQCIVPANVTVWNATLDSSECDPWRPQSVRMYGGTLFFSTVVVVVENDHQTNNHNSTSSVTWSDDNYLDDCLTLALNSDDLVEALQMTYPFVTNVTYYQAFLPIPPSSSPSSSPPLPSSLSPTMTPQQAQPSQPPAMPPSTLLLQLSSTSQAPTVSVSLLWLGAATEWQNEHGQGSNVFLHPRGSSNNNSNVPAVAIVAILLVGLFVVVGLLVFCCRRHRHQTRPPPQQRQHEPQQSPNHKNRGVAVLAANSNASNNDDPYLDDSYNKNDNDYTDAEQPQDPSPADKEAAHAVVTTVPLQEQHQKFEQQHQQQPPQATMEEGAPNVPQGSTDPSNNNNNHHHYHNSNMIAQSMASGQWFGDVGSSQMEDPSLADLSSKQVSELSSLK
ncbi:hypothetical protein ACA910_001567 [Epithemia clementina (nom. ined.)]